MRDLIGGGGCFLLLFITARFILHLSGCHAFLFSLLIEAAMFLFQIAIAEP